MILTIEREWGKEPGWFAALDHEAQVQLLAEYRLRHAPSKPPGPGGRARRLGRKR